MLSGHVVRGITNIHEKNDDAVTITFRSPYLQKEFLAWLASLQLDVEKTPAERYEEVRVKMVGIANPADAE